MIEVRISDRELLKLPLGPLVDAYVAQTLRDAGIPMVTGFDHVYRVSSGTLTESRVFEGRLFVWRGSKND